MVYIGDKLTVDNFEIKNYDDKDYDECQKSLVRLFIKCVYW